MDCLWCGAETRRRYSTHWDDNTLPGRFPGVLGLCMVHREPRLMDPADSGEYGYREEVGRWDYDHYTTDAAHECLCGHRSSYHNVRFYVDHFHNLRGIHGAPLCAPCARFIATASRSTLARVTPDTYERRETVEPLPDDEFAELTDTELGEAARSFFRKYEIGVGA